MKINLINKRSILPLNSILLIFVPLTIIILIVILWGIVAHQASMETLILAKNRSFSIVSAQLVNHEADQLQGLDQQKQTELITELLSEIPVSKENPFSIIIVNDAKKVVYSSSPMHSQESLPEHTGIEEALIGLRGEISERFSNGVHVINYEPIPDLGWALILEENWSEGATSMLNTTRLLPLLFIPLLLTAILLLWLINRSIITPLKSVVTLAQQVGNSQFQTHAASNRGAREIVELHDELVKMALKLDKAQKRMREYASTIQIAQEQERYRLSQELHDDTIQSLIHLDQQIQLLMLNGNGSHIPNESNFIKKIEKLRAQNGIILQNIRHIIQDLRPTYLDELGLVASLDMLSKQLAEGRNEKISVSIWGEPKRLNDQIELAFYRIAQEGVTNSLKHAQATHIDIFLAFLSNSVALQISDDGRGFSLADSHEYPGQFGLMGIRERAAKIDGELVIESGPSGTFIRLEAPI